MNSNISITPLTRKCNFCKKIYYKKVNQSRKKWRISKYCSKVCHDGSMNGKPSWNKGIKIDRNKYPNYGNFNKHTDSSKKKMAEALQKWRDNTSLEQQNIARTKGHAKAIATGLSRGSYKGTLGRTKELSFVWLGNNASYSSKHKWIQSHWQKTGVCEKCGKSPLPYGNRKWGTEWHSLDGEYNREDRKTWLEVCKSCHKLLDQN